MPELPEVETVVKGLNQKVRGLTIRDVWSDWPKYFKPHKSLAKFKNYVVGKKIIKATRRGKNILIELSDPPRRGQDEASGHLLLIHQKMTGHLLVGKWQHNKRGDGRTRTSGYWQSREPGPLSDPINDFIHLMFFLNNGQQLALSDVRKFAKVLCASKAEILKSEDLASLGPEPLEEGFTFLKFKGLFRNNPSTIRQAHGGEQGRTTSSGRRRGRIKQVLMDQNFIVGIGNIYSDDILYDSKIHPLSRVEKLKEAQIQALYKSIKKILKKALALGGTSIDDFRDTAGKKGKYTEVRLVYQKTGQKCPRGHIIKRIKLGGRSAHFCPTEQKLYK